MLNYKSRMKYRYNALNDACRQELALVTRTSLDSIRYSRCTDCAYQLYDESSPSRGTAVVLMLQVARHVAFPPVPEQIDLILNPQPCPGASEGKHTQDQIIDPQSIPRPEETALESHVSSFHSRQATEQPVSQYRSSLFESRSMLGD